MKDESDVGGTEKREITYVSRTPRSFFPCFSDETAIKNLICVLMFRHSGSQPYGVGIDLERMCNECRYITDSAWEKVVCSRDVVLNNSYHCSLSVNVIDLKCTICDRLIPYDSFFDALFS